MVFFFGIVMCKCLDLVVCGNLRNCVCGIDGLFYDNICYLMVVVCKRYYEVRVLYVGLCICELCV